MRCPVFDIELRHYTQQALDIAMSRACLCFEKVRPLKQQRNKGLTEKLIMLVQICYLYAAT